MVDIFSRVDLFLNRVFRHIEDSISNNSVKLAEKLKILKISQNLRKEKMYIFLFLIGNYRKLSTLFNNIKPLNLLSDFLIVLLSIYT